MTECGPWSSHVIESSDVGGDSKTRGQKIEVTDTKKIDTFKLGRD